MEPNRLDMGDRLRVPWKYGWRGGREGKRRVIVWCCGHGCAASRGLLWGVFLNASRIMISHFQPFVDTLWVFISISVPYTEGLELI